MTKVTVKYKNNKIVSVTAKEHAKFAKFGKDIVCAAVSVLMQTAVSGLTEVAKLDYLIFESDEKTAYMYFELPADLNETQALKAEVILETVVNGLQGIADAYPKNMRLYKEGGANIQ